MQRTTPPKQQFGLPDIGIPAEVLFHPKLSSTEKILYGLIRNLAHGEKGCYASNTWIAGLLGLNPQTISNSIGNLQTWELIIITRSKQHNTVTRHIYLNPEYPEIYEQFWTEEGYKKINRGVLKKLYPSIRKIIYPYKKNYIPLKEEEDSKKVSKKDSSSDFSKNGQIVPSQFEKFWKLYPKKVGKGAALTKWNAICNKPPKQRPTWIEIKRAVFNQKKSEQWQNAQYIPHATTWLNQSRWLDDPTEMRSYSRGDDKPKFIIEYGERWDLGKDGVYRNSEGTIYTE